MNYRKTWLTIGYCYVTTIIIVSLIKVPQVTISISHVDKFVHFLMYFIMMAWFGQLFLKNKQRIAILVSIISLGFILEILQGTTTYRSFDYWDALANSIGAIVAYYFLSTFIGRSLYKLDYFIKIRIFR